MRQGYRGHAQSQAEVLGVSGVSWPNASPFWAGRYGTQLCESRGYLVPNLQWLQRSSIVVSWFDGDRAPGNEGVRSVTQASLSRPSLSALHVESLLKLASLCSLRYSGTVPCFPDSSWGPEHMGRDVHSN